MRKILLFLAAVALCALNLSGAPYKPFNQDTVLVKKDGKYSLNFGAAFESVDNLFAHAREYPLRFDNEADKSTARTDTEKLVGLFESMEQQGMRSQLDDEGKFYFDLARSRLFVCAHNFDIAGAAERANSSYEQLLSTHNKQLSKLATSRVEMEFGIFLANAGQFERAKKQFEAAIAKGNQNAHYSLAMAYLAQGELKKAQSELEIYQKAKPDDKRVGEILEAIKSGRLEIKTHKK